LYIHEKGSMKPMRIVLGLLACATLFAQTTDLREPTGLPNNSLASFMLGETLLEQKNYQSAANEFRDALNGDLKPEWVVVWSRVKLARIFEVTGQRQRAVLEYQAAVRTNDNTKGALDEAIKFLKETGNTIPNVDLQVETPPMVLHVGPQVQPVGAEVVPPVRIDGDAPEYSDEARLAELEGTVLVEAVVGADSSLRDVRVMRSLGLGLDEKAVEAVRSWRFWPGMYQGNDIDTRTTIPVDFVLPSKHSRWHLIQARFNPPEGASRPVFRSVIYPPGAGVSRGLMDHARVVVTIGRQASATLSFEVDEQGRPVAFNLEASTDVSWGPEAIAVVQNWKFAPGEKDGKPVSVPCKVTLVWGRRNLSAEVIRNLTERQNPVAVP
jgi:TonB family protein